MKKIVCIIQARTGSTRLLNKVFLPLQGKAILLRVLDRVLEAKTIDHIIVATTIQPNDEKIVELVEGYSKKITTSRGSEEDVLDRYYKAGKEVDADIVVRVTSDNPLIDPDVIDDAVNLFLSEPNFDYVSNNIGKHTYPRGLDVEVVRFSTLEKLWKTTTEEIDREHVTIHIKRFPDQFKWKSLELKTDYSEYRWTVDEEEDYKLVSEIYDKLFTEKPNFRMEDVIEFLDKNLELKKINAHVEQQNKKY